MGFTSERKVANPVFATHNGGEVHRGAPIGKMMDPHTLVAFEMNGAHAHDVSTIIDREGIAVRAGTHCAQPLLARYGVTSTCRASFGLYNTRAEVDALVKALAKAHSFFA